ncbi:MAG: FkbM family methyltransferase [Gammaproteobacteria bacterium]|nr:FkbM family methyltransferase [Gammaproteobacteria bacterium]MBU1647635.1 FkbM family methyltransferase [Gammaproteobacteria bacterium]MBU1971523.1 FkbM family methyltransferase [Gammaproteobacteria bacterium]
MIDTALKKAVERLHRPPTMKILDPGLHRFLTRWWARHGEGRVVPAELFFGRRMNVVLPEVVSEQIYTYGLFDDVVSWLAVTAVRPGDTVLDIGAHFGYFTLLFSELAGPSGRVIAFEPTPSTYGLLKDNVSPYPNIVAANLALGRECGEAELSDHGLKYCAWNSLAKESRLTELPPGVSPRKVTVGLTSVDDYVRQNKLAPGLMKIDAENFEAEVILGAEHTLRTYAPAVIMETGSDAALQAGGRLLEMEYQVFVSEGCGSLERWSSDLASANARFKDILFVPPARVQQIVAG